MLMSKSTKYITYAIPQFATLLLYSILSTSDSKEIVVNLIRYAAIVSLIYAASNLSQNTNIYSRFRDYYTTPVFKEINAIFLLLGIFGVCVFAFIEGEHSLLLLLSVLSSVFRMHVETYIFKAKKYVTLVLLRLFPLIVLIACTMLNVVLSLEMFFYSAQIVCLVAALMLNEFEISRPTKSGVKSFFGLWKLFIGEMFVIPVINILFLRIEALTDDSNVVIAFSLSNYYRIAGMLILLPLVQSLLGSEDRSFSIKLWGIGIVFLLLAPLAAVFASELFELILDTALMMMFTMSGVAVLLASIVYVHTVNYIRAQKYFEVMAINIGWGTIVMVINFIGNLSYMKLIVSFPVAYLSVLLIMNFYEKRRSLHLSA